MSAERETEIGRCVFREANDAFFILDPADLRVLDANPAAQRLTGRRRKQLLALHLSDLVESARGNDLAELLRACQSTAYFLCSDGYFLRTAAGEKRAIQVSVSRIHTEPQPLGLLIVRDISRQKQAEAELADREARLRLLVEQMPAILWATDTDLRITSMLGAGLAALGLRPNQLAGTNLSDYLGTNDPEFRPLAMHRRALAGEAVRDELDWRGRTYEVHIEPLRTPDRTITGCIGVAHDVTARREAEEALQTAEANYRTLHAQKLESLGVLAGGIAHDFNNLLTGILGFANLAGMHLPPDSPVVPMLQEIERSARRAADLAQQMLAYSGRGKFVVRAIALDELVREMSTLLHTAVSRKAVLHLDLAPATIEGDVAQIRQVVMNLVTNASDALGEHEGVIAVRTGVRECDRAALQSPYLPAEPPEGSYAYVEVQDSGCGMTEETLSKIFDPFFTTKFIGRGLGLAAVLGIVRGHRGSLQVTSTPGQGTTFQVLFPAFTTAGGAA